MEAIQGLRRIGYRVFREGENIRCVYDGEAVPDPQKVTPFFDELKARKSEALAYLRLEEETRKALKQLRTQGFVKIYSNKVDREVCFIPDESARVLPPLGAVIFTFTELRELTARKASPEELKRLCDERDLGVYPANRGA